MRQEIVVNGTRDFASHVVYEGIGIDTSYMSSIVARRFLQMMNGPIFRVTWLFIRKMAVTLVII